MFLDSLVRERMKFETRNLKLIKNMEKKQYIMPTLRVKKINMLLMAGLSNYEEEGGDDQFSKGLDLDDDDNVGGDKGVWED